MTATAYPSCERGDAARSLRNLSRRRLRISSSQHLVEVGGSTGAETLSALRALVNLRKRGANRRTL